MKMQEEIVVELYQDLNYQSNGNQTTNELILKAPIGKHERALCKLHQKLARCLLEAAKMARDPGTLQEPPIPKEQEDSSDTEAQKSFTLLALRAGCKGDELYDFTQTFYKMIADGLCYINGPSGKVNVTVDLIRDLGFPDKNNILGEYIVNFIQPS